MEKMLISVTQSERQELRVVLIKNNIIQNMDIERTNVERRKGNIYVAFITSIEPSLGAVFVDYGPDRQGFLPIKEIAHCYARSNTETNSRDPSDLINALQVGQKLLVQVQKDERGNKGAALTTFISLAGMYLVIMPNSPNSGGVSRRISGNERSELKKTLSELNIPRDVGLIIRTAGVGKDIKELQWDLDALLRQWEAIKKVTDQLSKPRLIHKESDIFIRAVRDYLHREVEEIIVDDRETFENAKAYLQESRPDFVNRLKLYESVTPLFVKYQIEHQIEALYRGEMRLPSGGLIVINYTEALVSIDVNSARATQGTDIEETALNTNLEAAEAIARLLRLQDINGLIVIDFIDMLKTNNQHQVEEHLRQAVRLDRARMQIGRISQFGLLEMSRQRLHSSFGASNQTTCPRCLGRGTIQKLEALSLSLLRILEEEVTQESLVQIQAYLPVEVATFILNEKSHMLRDIEQRQSVSILIIPSPYLTTPHYNLRKIRKENQEDKKSYQLIEPPDIKIDDRLLRLDKDPEKPLLQRQTRIRLPRTKIKTEKKGGIIRRLFANFYNRKTKNQKEETTVTNRPQFKGRRPNKHRHRGRKHYHRTHREGHTSGKTRQGS